jgi:hypothetical protein
MVNYTDQAYEFIQNIHTTWEFLRKEFSKAMTIGVGTYSASGWTITDWGEWAPEDWRVYLAASDESELTYMEWDLFRLNYMIGTFRTQTGRPIVFTRKPDDTLLFYPIPDQAYTCVGEYFRSPHVMTANGDVPLWASAYHMAVVWKALQYYATDYAEPDKLSMGMREFNSFKRQLEKKYLPRLKYGRPLT